MRNLVFIIILGLLVAACEKKSTSPLDIKSGYYLDKIRLTKTKIDGQQIHYTIDGSKPTIKSPIVDSLLYIDNQTPNNNQITYIPTAALSPVPTKFTWTPARKHFLKATPLRLLDSKTKLEYSKTLFITKNIKNRFKHPIVSIITDPLNLFSKEKGIFVAGMKQQHDKPQHWCKGNFFQRGKQWEREAYMEFFLPNGELKISQTIGLRTHGGAGRIFPQKSLRLYAKKKYNNPFFEYPLFPSNNLKRYKRIILRTMAESVNYEIISNISNNLNIDRTASRLVVVYINGEYWGIQKLQERFDKYYFLDHFNIPKNKLDFLEDNMSVIEGNNKQYVSLIKYLKKYSLKNKKQYKYITERIEISNYIDFIILQTYFNNIDWPGSNNKFWQKNEKWRWVLHDMDKTFRIDNKNIFKYISSKKQINEMNPPWSTLLFRKLSQNPEFRTKFLNRYMELLNTILRPNNIIAEIDRLQSKLDYEISNHIKRWVFPVNKKKWLQRFENMRIFSRQRPLVIKQQLKDFFDIEITT